MKKTTLNVQIHSKYTQFVATILLFFHHQEDRAPKMMKKREAQRKSPSTGMEHHYFNMRLQSATKQIFVFCVFHNRAKLKNRRQHRKQQQPLLGFQSRRSTHVYNVQMCICKAPTQKQAQMFSGTFRH